MNRFLKKLLTSIIVTAMAISVSFIPGLFNFSAVNAASGTGSGGEYTATSDVFNLVANSTNNHTEAKYIWQNGDFVYVAIDTAVKENQLQGVLINDVVIDYSTWASNGSNGDNLIVKDTDGNIILNQAPIGKDTGKAPSWLIVWTDDIDFPVPSIRVTVNVPGGFALNNVTYQVVGAVNVAHVYGSDAPVIDSDQSKGSSIGGLTGTFNIHPEPKEGYEYVSVLVEFDDTTVASTSVGNTTTYNFTEGSVSIDAEGNVIVALTSPFNKKIDVIFTYALSSFTVDLSVNPGGSGSVSGDGTYPYLSPVQIVATANPGWTFVNWTDDDNSNAIVSSLATYNFNMPARNLNYTANFTENANVTINYIANTGGSVSRASESLPPVTGTALGSTATASAGYTFANWTKDGSVVSTDPTFVPAKVDGLNVAATYYANFTENPNITINYVATTGGSVSLASESLAPATGIAAGSTASANPGYSFVNWTKDGVQVSTSLTYVPPKVDGLNVAATYTANFAENANITINYVATTGGSVSLASESLAPATGIAAGSTASANPGYSFVNWTKDGVQVSTSLTYVPPKVDGLNVAATYTANFVENTNITINYNASTGGSVSRASESLAPATGEAQGSIASADPGYSFVNWTKDGVEVGTNEIFIPQKVGGLNIAATYTANFVENPNITINYVATTGGSVSLASESLAPATGTAAGSTATAAPGYSFVNWTKDGVEVSTSLAYVPPKVDGLNVAATYTANFAEDADVTINYIANTGGSVSLDSEDLAPATGVAAGSTATASLGYYFVNWTLDGVEVSDELTFVPDKVDGLNVAATYYANFELVDFTLVYVSNMPGITYPNETFNMGDSITPPAPTADGYNFLGWFEELMVEQVLSEPVEVDIILNPEAFYFDDMPARNVTVYGLWEEIDYTFTFDPNYGEELVVEQTFQIGGSVEGTTFTRDGFTFIGWTLDEDGEVPYTGGLTNLPAEDIYVYAQWSEDIIEYVLVFVTNMEGLSYDNITFVAGDSIVAPVPEMEGFVFLGWYVDEDYIDIFDEFGSMPARNVTVFADWGEVLGDEDEIPDTSDSGVAGHMGMILFILGLLAIVLTKKEDELLD
jgi:uncharacterized repeat protein (TIGR02543 family)